MILGDGGSGDRDRGGGPDHNGEPVHAASPRGRTLTTRIIPAIM